MSAVRQWIGGTPALHRAVEGTMKETDPKSVISENPHRRMIQSRDSTCGELVIKEFQAPKGTRRITAALGRDPARREWQMLTRLHAAARNVPRPHATARLHDGRTWIVMECLAGRSLASVLGDCRAPRQQLMQKLGSELTRLHSEGFVHGDLHVGNWHVTPDDEPILLDFQRGRRTRSRAARIRDVGEFDFSLALEGVSLSGRLRFRIAALDLPSPLDHAAREQVRAAGRASEARGRQYFRRRTRHFKRPGRHIRPVEHEGARGLRLSSFPEPAVRASLSAHREVLSRGGSDVLKQDHRARVTRVRLDEGAVVVKEVTKMGLRRWLADRLRGSPARRAWIGGHGLQIRGIRAATPLAFVEKTRMGIPVKSLVILEDLHPAVPAHTLAGADVDDGTRLSAALRRLATALHRAGVIHGDLQSPHVFIQPARAGAGTRFETSLIDLEGVRFRRQLSTEERIQALVELNASIADQLVPGPRRQRDFELYAQALPFASAEPGTGGLDGILREIVRRSLARGHFWKGADCSPVRSGLTSD